MQQVFITGANRGIGLGFVELYLARGARVFAGCRAPENVPQLQVLGERYPEQLSIVTLDVSDEDIIKAAYQMISAQAKVLDLLINNAGVFHASPRLNEITAHGLRDSLAV